MESKHTNQPASLGLVIFAKPQSLQSDPAAENSVSKLIPKTNKPEPWPKRAVVSVVDEKYAGL
jgi:hypothetical protein